MTVLFGQSYYLRFDPKLWAAQQPYAPLGTLYAASALRDVGYEVALFDAMLATSEREWSEALDRHAPHLAVIYEDSFNYLSKMCLGRMRQAALAMTTAAKARGWTTVVAGPDASDHPELYLGAGADFVVLGEGEETLRELADVVSGRTRLPLDDVAGLAFRAAGASPRRTRPRPFIRDLDRRPFPAWDLVDVEAYRRIWRRRHGYFSMNLVTTRGCPYHCNWCAKPIYGQRYEARTAENVVEEMAWLAREYRPDHLWFADDIFGLKPGWIERFADAVAAAGVAVPFKCLMRPDLVRAATAAALARAGCRTVWLGAESGAQRVLDAMEKGVRVDQIPRATQLLHEAGIEVGFFLQFGYPGETREDIEETLAMVRRAAPDDIGVSVSYPLPGTPFYDRVRAQLGAKRNWDDSSDLAMLYRGPFPTEFYRELHAAVHAEFRLRHAWRALRARRSSADRHGRLHRALSLVRHAARLLVARARLRRLARRAHDGIAPLAPALSPEAAARPSEQE
jgi:anaerobic magnesium-protoporphyrin IX monomethyl ester cyclase